VSWAIEDIGDRGWMRASCVSRALAAQWMFRRRRIASRLHLHGADSHAWIELGQDVIDIDTDESTPTVTRSIAFGGHTA
jgi:hypothetical protein